MSTGPLITRMQERLAFDKEDGDIAYFYALLLQLEYITKLVVSGVVACLGEDADRSRYSLEYALVRANSLGDWVTSLNNALTGPPAQFFLPHTTHILRDLTQGVTGADWRFAAVSRVAQVAQHFGIRQEIGHRTTLRHFFEIAAAIRNRTRGHGATTSTECHLVCPMLEQAIGELITNLQVFQHDWAHIHRNLTGKYRVSPLLGACTNLNKLKNTRDSTLPNGVYVDVAGFHLVPLIRTTPGIPDIYLPNGNFKGEQYEVLSFFTNSIDRVDGALWSNPPGRLPARHTEGSNVLEQIGNVFTNLPASPSGKIARERLESDLLTELLNLERHPIVTLTGQGGIGKTTLTLAVVESLAKSRYCPYEVILWISSRDVDLLDSGPKPVNPKVVTKLSIAQAAVDLLEPQGSKTKFFDTEAFFEGCLTKGAAGTTLFIRNYSGTTYSAQRLL